MSNTDSSAPIDPTKETTATAGEQKVNHQARRIGKWRYRARILRCLWIEYRRAIRQYDHDAAIRKFNPSHGM